MAFYLVIIILCFTACTPFRDSPFSDHVVKGERDLNNVALTQLKDVEADAVVRIAVFADSHNNYRDLDRVVNQINHTQGVDFVVNLGDFTNSAYNFEYDQFITSHIDLNYPTFTVVGNHDAIGAGPALFKKVFGPANFWFETATARFIFSHIALNDSERFSLELFDSILHNTFVKLVVNGHKHVYALTEVDGTVLLQAPRVQDQQWLLLTLTTGN